MIIASKCGRFWALHILVQCAFRYFSCGKRNEIFRLRKVVLKLTALVPSTLQRCRSNRDFGAVVRAEISSVLSRMKSQQSLEISAGSGCSAARKKRPRLPCVWGILVFFSVLGYLRARRFFCEMRSHTGPKPVLMQINSRKLPGLTQAVRLRMGKFDLQKTSKIQIENDKVVAKELLTSGIGGDVQNIRRKIPERIFNQIM